MKESKFQFKNPELVELEFVINEDFDNDKFESISLIYWTGIQVADDEKAALVTLYVTVGSKKTDEKECNEPFYINTVIRSEFRWQDGVETVDKLLRINAPILLLSYLRPIIASITNSSPFPAYNLPYLDFTEEEQESVSITREQK